jgi:hypothetical protein
VKRAARWGQAIEAKVREDSHSPTVTLSLAQIEQIWKTLPDPKGDQEEFKDDIEHDIQSALNLPKWLKKMSLPQAHVRRIRDLQSHADAILNGFSETDSAYWFFLEYCAARSGTSLETFLTSALSLKFFLDTACENLPNISYWDVERSQRRFFSKRLSWTWWSFTELEARRSCNQGQFGCTLLKILEVLAQTDYDLAFLGDLGQASCRESIAARMLRALDRTRAGGSFVAMSTRRRARVAHGAGGPP